MGAERVDYYSEEEYLQAIQQEEWEEIEHMREQDALNNMEMDEYFKLTKDDDFDDLPF